jgi:hypothetical protein
MRPLDRERTPDPLINQQPTWPAVTVNCFFGCGHTEEGSPLAVHAAMEAHYSARHQAQIDAITGRQA